MGGAWERMISSIRKIVQSLLGCQTLTDESYFTLMAEVKATIISRPLIPVSSTSSGQEPFTQATCCFCGEVPIRLLGFSLRATRVLINQSSQPFVFCVPLLNLFCSCVPPTFYEYFLTVTTYKSCADG